MNSLCVICGKKSVGVYYKAKLFAEAKLHKVTLRLPDHPHPMAHNDCYSDMQTTIQILERNRAQRAAN